MLKGTVKFYNRQKCFGFITPDNGTDDLFVSATALSASGLKTLEVGQRVSFESAGDPKGAKAVQIKLEGGAPQAATPASQTAPASDRILVYYDPSIQNHQDVIAEVEAFGRPHRFVDYTATPPDREELKRLSLMLREDDQSPVRRYDPMFFELQLDDRFISENEFWAAIIEHPKLINGPILQSGRRARVCKSASEAQLFLDNKERKPVKAISSRILALINGQPLPPLPPEEEMEEEEQEAIIPHKTSADTAATSAKKKKPEPAPNRKPAVKVATKSPKAPAAKKAKKPVKPASKKKAAPIGRKKK
jgi:cold shock CspA family protein/arsenate reductase-like glutaredoxin family protein